MAQAASCRPVTAKARVRSQWPSGLTRGSVLAAIAGLNPAGSMDVCGVFCRGINDMRTVCEGTQWINRTERKKEKEAQQEKIIDHST